MLLDIYKEIRQITYERRQRGGKKKAQSLVEKNISSTGLKSGPFAESLLEEVVRQAGFKFDSGSHLNIYPNSKLTKKEFFSPDGYIEEIDMFLESKNYQFFSSGTANEKLYGFLAKVPHYTKPVILVFCGEHEKRLHDECNSIWEIYHDNPVFDDHIFAGPIKKLRDEGQLLLTNIMELDNFLKEIANA
jgi:hypothetical protein